jgi:hypothetical protein
MYIEIIESVMVKTRPESVDLPTYMRRILMTVRHVFQPSNGGFLTHVTKRNLLHSSHPQALTSPPLFAKTPSKLNVVLTHELRISFGYQAENHNSPKYKRNS